MPNCFIVGFSLKRRSWLLSLSFSSVK